MQQHSPLGGLGHFQVQVCCPGPRETNFPALIGKHYLICLLGLQPRTTPTPVSRKVTLCPFTLSSKSCFLSSLFCMVILTVYSAPPLALSLARIRVCLISNWGITRLLDWIWVPQFSCLPLHLTVHSALCATGNLQRCSAMSASLAISTMFTLLVQQLLQLEMSNYGRCCLFIFHPHSPQQFQVAAGSQSL